MGNVPIALAGLYTLHVMAFFLKYEDVDGDFQKLKNWYTVEWMGISTDNRTVDTGVVFHGPESKFLHH